MSEDREELDFNEQQADSQREKTAIRASKRILDKYDPARLGREVPQDYKRR